MHRHKESSNLTRRPEITGGACELSLVSSFRGHGGNVIETMSGKCEATRKAGERYGRNCSEKLIPVVIFFHTISRSMVSFVRKNRQRRSPQGAFILGNDAGNSSTGSQQARSLREHACIADCLNPDHFHVIYSW